MVNNIYSSTLTEKSSETKSYDLNKLWYLAFFGGVIPITVLGIQNAKMLHVEKIYIRILMAISIIFFIAKFVIIGIIFYNDLNHRAFKGIILGMGAIVYIFYYNILKRPYNEHLLAGGGTEPFLKKGILWSILAIIIELVLIVIVIVLTTI